MNTQQALDCWGRARPVDPGQVRTALPPVETVPAPDGDLEFYADAEGRHVTIILRRDASGRVLEARALPA